MTKILFVCLGNICRSPMAEAVFRELVLAQELSEHFVIESRATSNWNEGKPPHPGTTAKLAEHQIGVTGMSSAQIKGRDFSKFDLILAMDEQNIRELKQLSPKRHQHKIKSFLTVLPETTYQGVPDPYYTGDFELTYQLVDEASRAWLVKLTD